MDNSNVSINGYYMRPTLSYKATTLFGADEELKALVGGDLKISFADMLKTNLTKVNDLQVSADDLATQFVLGETDNIHQVMIAGQKAEIALQLTTAIRSKVMEAYQEIMRMQI